MRFRRITQVGMKLTLCICAPIAYAEGGVSSILPANPFSAARQLMQGEAAADSSSRSAAPLPVLPPPAPSALDQDIDRTSFGALSVASIYGDGAVLKAPASGAGGLTYIHLRHMKPSLVQGQWVIPTIEAFQVTLYRAIAGDGRSKDQFVPDRARLPIWAGRFVAHNGDGQAAADAPPVTVGTDPVSPSRRAFGGGAAATVTTPPPR